MHKSESCRLALHGDIESLDPNSPQKLWYEEAIAGSLVVFLTLLIDVRMLSFCYPGLKRSQKGDMEKESICSGPLRSCK